MTSGVTHELVLRRVIEAARDKVYRAWTEPDLLKKWFTPPPWTTDLVTLDLRPGGIFETVMRDPEGNGFTNSGVFLEIVPNERLVFTDAYTAGWMPARKPFMTGVIELAARADGMTLYTARALHWRAEDMKAHEDMGFHSGWGKAAEQLEEVAAAL